MIKVLYIAGAGRSGSTLLARLLGNLPGFWDVGEMSWWWSHMQAGRPCGCGLPLTACDFWSDVMARLREHDGIDPGRVAHLGHKLARTRTLGMFRPRKPGKAARREREEFVRATIRLYETVSRKRPDAFIVDASKTPTHLGLLQSLPDIDLRVLHLVRDGRAVAYSWSKRGRNPVAYRSVYASMAAWMIKNVMIENLVRRQPWAIVKSGGCG